MKRRSFLTILAGLAVAPHALLGASRQNILIHRGNTETDADRLERLIRTTGRAVDETFVLDRMVDLTPYDNICISNCVFVSRHEDTILFLDLNKRQSMRDCSFRTSTPALSGVPAMITVKAS